jgi:hypothetical protein
MATAMIPSTRTSNRRRSPRTESDRAAIIHPDPALMARLTAILSVPNPHWFGEESLRRCECSACNAIRRAGMTCAECGYVGEPVVSSCECREARASNIAHCRKALAAIEAGAPVLKGDLGAAYLERRLREELASPDQMCQAKSRAGCCHGYAVCPTCGNDGDGETAEGTILAALIRHVRAVLSAH